MRYCLYAESLKKRIQTNLFMKQKQTQTWRNELRVEGAGGRGREERVREFGVHMHTLLYLKLINKDLLYSTGNSVNIL